MKSAGGISLRQRGIVLLISLVFLLLLALIGLSSMQGAVTQQKIAGSLWHRNQSFQAAESGLRLGEEVVRRKGADLPQCHSIVACGPPDEALSVVAAGTSPVSSVNWVAIKGGALRYSIPWSERRAGEFATANPSNVVPGDGDWDQWSVTHGIGDRVRASGRSQWLAF